MQTVIIEREYRGSFSNCWNFFYSGPRCINNKRTGCVRSHTCVNWAGWVRSQTCGNWAGWVRSQTCVNWLDVWASRKCELGWMCAQQVWTGLAVCTDRRVWTGLDVCGARRMWQCKEKLNQRGGGKLRSLAMQISTQSDKAFKRKINALSLEKYVHINIS